MKKTPSTSIETPDLSGLSAAELRLVMAQMQQQFQRVIDEKMKRLKMLIVELSYWKK